MSPDDVASHTRFKAKYELPFTLLADPEHVAAEAFGVWKERKNYGRTYMGVERSTFVIDQDGRVLDDTPRAEPADDGKNRGTSRLDPGSVITKALRAAGLMK